MSMTEWIVALVGAGVALVVWRALKAGAVPSFDGVMRSGFGHEAQRPGPDIYHWPRLGLFEFEVDETAHPLHQNVLRRALEQHGPYCVATLVPRGKAGDTGAPVAVEIDARRVGFLSMGDATRFHRRLAYESRCGQVSQCGALISGTSTERRGKGLTVLLDLKPFRH
jgi:hypothetical protein